MDWAERYHHQVYARSDFPLPLSAATHLNFDTVLAMNNTTVGLQGKVRCLSRGRAREALMGYCVECAWMTICSLVKVNGKKTSRIFLDKNNNGSNIKAGYVLG